MDTNKMEDLVPPAFQVNDLVYVSGLVTSFPFRIVKMGYSPSKEGFVYTLTPDGENSDMEIRVSERDLHREEDNEFEGITAAEIQKTTWKMFFEKTLKGLKRHIETYDASSLIVEVRNAGTDGANETGVSLHYASDGREKTIKWVLFLHEDGTPNLLERSKVTNKYDRGHAERAL
jgi:hypothetical protein